MKICCKAFKEFIHNIEDYPSVVFKPNISDNGITFDLAFTQKSDFGQSWHYISYCPFCGNRLEGVKING